MKERDLGEGGVEQEPQARPDQKLQHWSRVWRQPAKQEAQQQRREVDPYLVSFEGVFRHHGPTMIRLHEVGKGAQGIAPSTALSLTLDVRGPDSGEVTQGSSDDRMGIQSCLPRRSRMIET